MIQPVKILLARRGRMAAVGLAALLLGGCSSTPDWANPVEWYKGAKSLVVDEEPEAADARARAAEKTVPPGETFPNLASVPERPADIASGQKREEVKKDLAADRAQARYSELGPGDNAMGEIGPAPAGPGAPPPAVIAPPPEVTTPPPASRVAPTEAPPAAPPPAPQGEPSPESSVTPPDAPVQIAGVPPESQEMRAMPPTGEDGTRAAFEAALSQSAPTVSTAPAGLRDMNQSAVTVPVRRNTVPLPATPPPGRVNLTPPAEEGLAQIGGDPSHLGTVLFANASSALSGEAVNLLRDIAKTQKEKGGTLRIVGHASHRTRNVDPLDHRLVNFRLSLDRAQAVARQLVRLGVPAKDVAVVAQADNEPLYYEVMPAGEAANRRAEIYLDY